MRVVKRLKFNDFDIETLRAYYPSLPVQKIIENAVQNEIRRNKKQRLTRPF